MRGLTHSDSTLAVQSNVMAIALTGKGLREDSGGSNSSNSITYFSQPLDLSRETNRSFSFLPTRARTRLRVFRRATVRGAALARAQRSRLFFPVR
jgi:hypothetical protein